MRVLNAVGNVVRGGGGMMMRDGEEVFACLIPRLAYLSEWKCLLTSYHIRVSLININIPYGG